MVPPVSDVVPLPLVHVKVLDAPDHRGAVGWAVAPPDHGVVDEPKGQLVMGAKFQDEKFLWHLAHL